MEKEIDESKKAQDKQWLYQEWRRLLIRVGIMVVAGYILFGHVLMLAQMSGMDMFPAIKDGDLMLAFRLQSSYERDDVVVYTQDGDRRVGRIVALATDVVEIDEEGTVRVNGTLQEGEILYPTYTRNGEKLVYTVPEGTVYVLGDYRTTAEDSRDFEAIQEADVKGKVLSIFRRRGL